MLWLHMLSTSHKLQKLTAMKMEQTSSSKCHYKHFCPTCVFLNILLGGEDHFEKYTSHVLENGLNH